MNITEPIVKNLLEKLVSPKYDDIVDYNINIAGEYMGGTGMSIDVIMKHRIVFHKDEEYAIERSIRNTMKYLSTSIVMVEFYMTNDY